MAQVYNGQLVQTLDILTREKVTDRAIGCL